MRAVRSLSFLLVVALWAAAGSALAEGARDKSPLVLRDATGETVDPLGVGTNKAVVLLFISTDCPISNAYAPEVNRLAAEYGPKGVILRLVYADADVTPSVARKHLGDYRYTMQALLDPDQKLASRLGAKVTPEAFLVGADGKTVYHGRIDDLFPALGKRRQQPTERNLRDALQEFLSGRPVTKPFVEAVGCYLPPPKKP